MKQVIIFIGLIINILGCADSTAQSKLLNPNDFEILIKSDKSVQLVDVRTPQEVAQGHLPNALNINIADADFQAKMGKLDKSKPIAVYCGVGGRSGRAAKMLSEMGFKKIYDLEGGLKAWNAAGKATVSQ
jgi:rhodanese-related sulfurtransferase